MVVDVVRFLGIHELRPLTFRQVVSFELSFKLFANVFLHFSLEQSITVDIIDFDDLGQSSKFHEYGHEVSHRR
jgi:hypothetical protein